MNKVSFSAPIFIAGPTAVGKSAVALALAEKVGGEIISVDSMQVYRGLDIGTAKPNHAERKQVPHHLVDVAGLAEPFDAATFISLAQKAIGEIQSRGRTPILCGGTGLYFKAFLDGIGDAPPANAAVRAEIEAASLPALLHELEQNDPVTFAKIDKKNPRRVVRAVEVIRLTGKPFSAQRSDWATQDSKHKPQNFIGLSRDAADLHARVNARVDDMFRLGLVDETRKLLKHGLEQNRTAMQAIGYRQVVEHLRGERSLPDTVELVKIKTRQFAKRQMTWFRRQLRLDWLAVERDESTAAIMQRIHNSVLIRS